MPDDAVTADLFEIMRTTRSMRRLKPDPVPDASLRRILEAEICAPSGGNMQRWRRQVVKDAVVKATVGGSTSAPETSRSALAIAPANRRRAPAASGFCACSVRPNISPPISTRRRSGSSLAFKAPRRPAPPARRFEHRARGVDLVGHLLSLLGTLAHFEAQLQACRRGTQIV
jgi:nitroreductase